METRPTDQPTFPPTPSAPSSADSSFPTPGKLVPERPHDADEAEERDVWWGAYAGRTMMPGFVLCGLLTAILIGIAWLLGARNGSSTVRYVTEVCIAALWILQLGRWAYRVLAINYRLTTRRLFCERGFHHPGSPGIELASIAQIVVDRGPLERLMGVGRIRVVLQTTPSQALVLEGIRDPEHVSLVIRRRVQQLRAQGVSTT